MPVVETARQRRARIGDFDPTQSIDFARMDRKPNALARRRAWRARQPFAPPEGLRKANAAASSGAAFAAARLPAIAALAVKANQYPVHLFFKSRRAANGILKDAGLPKAF